jgi:hypothetical protein
MTQLGERGNIHSAASFAVCPFTSASDEAHAYLFG